MHVTRPVLRCVNSKMNAHELSGLAFMHRPCRWIARALLPKDNVGGALQGQKIKEAVLYVTASPLLTDLEVRAAFRAAGLHRGR